ncbi:DedA family protein [Lonsdalea britannica]|uniref:DedA family protein n=1 Tax=Lonsdalea britannica TaxID=1082704 RepID=A0AAD0WJJ8_9GAMM|nr:YqaA family protein [Lonsdalea britannica]AXW85717.1 DedA family protein [Lonsdalea britannica]
MSEVWSFISLFWSSFLSATLLPGSSEVVLVSLLLTETSSPWLLVMIATVGNTLGGFTNMIVGRFLPKRHSGRGRAKAQRWLERYGVAALLFSWVPIIGDMLCVLAGWLRLPWGRATLCIFIGKALRYLVLCWMTLQGVAWWS